MASLILNFKRHFTNQGPSPAIIYPDARSGFILQSFLKDCENSGGYHIEIGAHHPYLFSNTDRSFQKGWQRIVIEPSAKAASLYRLFVNTDGKLNTETDSGKAGRYGVAKQQKQTITSFPIIKTVDIRKISLTEILDNNIPAEQALNFLSIDMDGLDLRALKSNNWNRYRPLFVVVKSRRGVQFRSVFAVYNLLKRKNYEQVFKTPGASLFKLKQN